MPKVSKRPSQKELKDYSVHLPHVEISQEEEAKRLSNLKSLLAQAKTRLYTHS